MPYLVAVVKVCLDCSVYLQSQVPHFAQETFRVHPILIEIQRVPKRDIVLPLVTPVVGVSGRIYKELPVPAGTHVNVSLLGYNLYVFLLDLRPYKCQD